MANCEDGSSMYDDYYDSHQQLHNNDGCGSDEDGGPTRERTVSYVCELRGEATRRRRLASLDDFHREVRAKLADQAAVRRNSIELVSAPLSDKPWYVVVMQPLLAMILTFIAYRLVFDQPLNAFGSKSEPENTLI